MKVLDYVKPKGMEEALSFLNKYPDTTKILAGGTDLIIQMRLRELQPDYILDLAALTDLKAIKIEGEDLVIGSMATFDEIEHNPLVQKYAPVLAEAAGSIGSPQIRNRGTIGGNIVNAAVAADTLPALLALDAKVKLVSPGEERLADLQRILVGPNKTSIKRDEILTEIFVSLPKKGACGAFVKIGRRKAMAIARLNLALQLTFDAENKIASAKLALGAVGTTAYRVEEVEKILVGQTLTNELIEDASGLVSHVVAQKLGSRPTAPYKKTIAGAALRKAFDCIKAEDKGA